jgi:hypothetical protein
MHLHPSRGHASNKKPRKFLALRTDLRQKAQAVVAGAVTINASSYECKRKKKKESGTPKNADPYPLYLAVQLAPCKARSPIGVPPRFLPKGVIVPKAHPGPGFVRRAPRGGFAADASPHSQRAPRAPVIVPAGLIPETPGSGSDEPPPAGTASRSDQPGSPADVLHGEREWVRYSNPKRDVKAFRFVQINRCVNWCDPNTTREDFVQVLEIKIRKRQSAIGAIAAGYAFA